MKELMCLGRDTIVGCLKGWVDVKIQLNCKGLVTINYFL